MAHLFPSLRKSREAANQAISGAEHVMRTLEKSVDSQRQHTRYEKMQQERVTRRAERITIGAAIGGDYRKQL